jgi:hypothetical protein
MRLLEKGGFCLIKGEPPRWAVYELADVPPDIVKSGRLSEETRNPNLVPVNRPTSIIPSGEGR